MHLNQYLQSILSLPTIVDEYPLVSPDGRWIAWSWMRVAPTIDVYVAPSDGSAAPTRLTQVEQDCLLEAWLPDSSGVLVGHDQDGNERLEVFRVDLDNPLHLQRLTDPQPDNFLRSPRLHPNGRWLVYGANYDFDARQEIEPTWLYRHDLQTGERRLLARPTQPSYMLPELNHPGTHVLYTRQERHPAGRQIWLADIDGTVDEEVLNFGDQVKAFAHWFPDGLRAIVLAETPTHRRLGVWHLDNRQIDWLLDDPQRDIEDAFVPANCTAENAVIVLVENLSGRTQCSLIDPHSGAETPVRAPDGDLLQGNLIPLAPLQPPASPQASGSPSAPQPTQPPASPHPGQSTSAHPWAALYYSSTHPKDILRVHLQPPTHDSAFTSLLLDDPSERCNVQTLQRSNLSLTDVWSRTSLTRASFTPAQDFHWHSVDGLEVHGWLYRASVPAKGTIVYVHGGPTWHSQDWINAQIQYFVQQGFNVLDPNYRGSTGYGLPFRLAILEHGWGSLEQEDIRTGVEALITAGIAEPGKVGITGTSYGGYSAWHAITHFPVEIIAAAAPVCSMTDLVIDYETTRPDLRPYSEEMMGGSPSQVPERYYQRSPIHFVQQIQGKLLIVQGEQDPNVTPENVRAVRSALEQAAIPYELLTFPDEGHGISRPANQVVLFQRLAEFFERAFAKA